MKKLSMKKALSVFLAAIMTLTAMAGMLTFSAGAEGSTTTADVSIGTPEQLKNFFTRGKDDIYEGQTIVLTADIDMADTPVTVGEGRFAGTFDGQGHTIKNLTITNSSTNGIGVFGKVATGKTATVKNLVILSSTYLTNKWQVGGIFGDVLGTVNIENVYSAMNVGGTWGGWGDVGGFVGKAYGACNITIKNCVYAGTVRVNVAQSGQNCAGFVATHVEGGVVSIENCAMYGTVDTSTKCGGFVVNPKTNNTIKNCVFAGSVTNTNYFYNNVAGTFENNLYASETDLEITGATRIGTGIANQAILDDNGMTAWTATTTGYPVLRAFANYSDPKAADEGAVTATVGYQTTKVGDDGSFGFRLVGNLDANVDLTAYDKVGFKVVAFLENGTGAARANDCEITQVYETISADYGTQSFSEAGKYLFVQEFDGLNTSNGDIVFEITTYATASDGTETVGAACRFVLDVSELSANS